MARFRKIYRGPAYKPQPQVRDRRASVDILPGTFVQLNADTEFAPADGATDGRLYIAQDNYMALKSVDDVCKAGDTMQGMELLDDRMFGARLAAGQSVAEGDALSLNGSGHLVAAGASALVVAYANETYNNDTGETQLIDIRVGQTYVTSA